MPGITAFGTYIPIYRLQQEEIARMWRTRPVGGQKAVVGFDEDCITMAVAAGACDIELAIGVEMLNDSDQTGVKGPAIVVRTDMARHFRPDPIYIKGLAISVGAR